SPPCPPACAFFGTSAATPHSAAVAALLLSKNPSLTPAHIQEALRGGALDIGPAGFDDAAGAGRLDALAAAALVCTADAQCDDANACTVDACDHGTCTHSPVPCDDGDACTVDACDGGTCTHSPVVCDDGRPQARRAARPGGAVGRRRAGRPAGPRADAAQAGAEGGDRDGTPRGQAHVRPRSDDRRTDRLGNRRDREQDAVLARDTLTRRWRWRNGRSARCSSPASSCSTGSGRSGRS